MTTLISGSRAIRVTRSPPAAWRARSRSNRADTVARNVRSKSWNFSGWNRVVRLNEGAASFFCRRQRGPFA